jgi:D-sedoheptulose 7-phosphate isomerase
MKLLSTLADAHVKALTATIAEVESTWAEVATHAATALKSGQTLLFCGNGGSACDAMHIAGELVGRFVHDRKALPAIALSADSGILTAIGNDYGFDRVFSRQIEAYGKAGSLLFALSTSGTSPNVVKALQVAQEIGMKTVLLTGERGRNAPVRCDYRIVAASEVTAHIQEIHILLLHALASMIEANLA